MGASEFKAVMETCEFHGLYQVNHPDSNGVSRWLPGCPKCSREREMAGIIGRAAIPPRFQSRSFDNFVAFAPKQKLALEIATAYADAFDENLIDGRCLLFCGAAGTGKTHLACAVLHEIVRKGRTGIYATVGAAVRRVKDTWSRKGESEREVLAQFVTPDLLVLDEVGVQFGSEAERIILFDMINGRYENVRPTIVISNLDVAGVEENLGYRSVDRLRENGGRVVVFDWESHRKGGPAA